MIKFFRRIRKRLLSEKRLGNYLLYAIGEVALVVIGILIALQINNWNEQNKMEARELQALVALKSDIRQNLEDLNEGILATERRRAHNTRIVQLLESGGPIHDSTVINLNWNNLATWEPTFVKSNYENLKLEGMSLISNQALRDEISNYFDLRLVNIEVKENERLYRLQENMVIPLRLKYFHRDCEGDDCKLIPNDVNELMKVPEFYAVCTEYLYWQKRVINRFGNVKQRSLDLLDAIDSELEARS